MSRNTLLVCLTTFALAVAASASSVTPAKVSAAEIIAKNAAARGGLQAWRAVHSLTMTGKLEAGGNNRPTLPIPGRKLDAKMPSQRQAEQVQLPFVLKMERPRKTRLEIEFRGQTALQVFNGVNGWKVRPFLNRHEVEPFTAEEAKTAALESELDGPLIDSAAKGTKVDVEGIEQVEGHDAYKLKLTLKDGQVRHLWVDAQNFLDLKIDGTQRRLDGKYHPVSTYFHDYRRVNGLMIPHLLETAVDSVKQTEKIQVESVVVNPKFEDTLFTKPK